MDNQKQWKDAVFDVAIIGAGITGILNAYLLSKEGKKVVLIERDSVGNGATRATTAFITQMIDTDISKVESLFGSKSARLVMESHGAAIDEIERIVRVEKIDCDFVRCPNYLYANTKKQFEHIKEEYPLYKKFSLKATLHTKGGELNFPNFGYMEIQNQAKFSATRFVTELSNIIAENGVIILENTKAVKITDADDLVEIHTSDGVIRTKRIIIATYKPLTNEKTHLKKAMYRSYVFEVEIPKHSFKEALYEDSGNPYHYFRIDSGEEKDSMIVGGEDHKDIFGKSLKKESFKGLEKYVDKILGDTPHKITNRWDGPISEPSDGLALIGEIKPNYYVATGFSGNGMTYSTISAMLIRDLIMGKKNAWASVYDPKRSLLHPKRLASKAKDYAEEFFGGAVKNLLS